MGGEWARHPRSERLVHAGGKMVVDELLVDRFRLVPRGLFFWQVPSEKHAQGGAHHREDLTEKDTIAIAIAIAIKRQLRLGMGGMGVAHVRASPGKLRVHTYMNSEMRTYIF